ncbi:MAG: hypothetical protein U0350_51610 [Caldilineaceae bacterium]
MDQWGPTAINMVKPGGVLWISYRKSAPKGEARTLHCDVGWETLYPAGWEGVSLIAIDGTWAAMRFRPAQRLSRAARAGRRWLMPGKVMPKRIMYA